ncbi:MAG: DNA replication protein [Firmicutes bacterium]|nr:DNA replication protein [Bacillota bacterium]
MADRRMFTKKIIDSDAFLDMPLSTQCLYFHLNMQADDDGFLNNPRKIQRMIGASDDDLKLLITKRFLLAFENGVVVVKHWRMHNLLRKDRHTATHYQDEMSTLLLKEDGSYTEKVEIPMISESGNQMATSWQPNGNPG